MFPFMNKSIRVYWPLGFALCLLGGVILFYYFQSISPSQGKFIYAIDDAYIHMAIAKNFAQQGVFGVTPYEFSHSCSSPLWVFLLSLFFLFGNLEILPFLLNIVIAGALLTTVFLLLNKAGERRCGAAAACILLLLLFLTPLPALIFSGMEHILHALIAVLFVWFAAKALAAPENKKIPLQLLILSFLHTAVRYEGLFFIAVVVFLFCLQKRFKQAAAVLTAGCLPVFLMGFLGLSHGASFLPNTLILKGSFPRVLNAQSLTQYIANGYLKLAGAPHLAFPFFLSLIVFFSRWDRERLSSLSQNMLLIFIFTLPLHTQFSSTGWFFRYEAYMTALGVFILGWTFLEENAREKSPAAAIFKFTLLLFLIPYFTLGLAQRAQSSLAQIPAAISHIYRQQYQMGLFLKQYYSGQAIVAGDVGAINYLTDLKCLDWWGVASDDATKMIRKGRTPQALAALAELAVKKQCRMAILYDQVATGQNVGIPASWIKTGSWRMQSSLYPNLNVVSFYALEPEEAPALRKALEEFRASLPAGVEQTLY